MFIFISFIFKAVCSKLCLLKIQACILGDIKERMREMATIVVLYLYKLFLTNLNKKFVFKYIYIYVCVFCLFINAHI